MQKYPLKIVNFFYGFKCNLSCHGCLSGSDMIHHKNHDPDLENILLGIRNLSNYVSDITIMATILGGEPLLYWDEKVVPIIYEIRKHWPNVTLNITTNGLLLHKFGDKIIDTLIEFGNIKLQISKHASNVGPHPFKKIYDKNLLTFLSNPKLNKIHDLHYDVPNNTVDVHLDQWDQPFVSQFVIKDGKLKPFATQDPVGSMKHGCTGNICAMVKDNRLYKCGRLAVLPKILEERSQLDDPDWQPYLHTYVDLTKALPDGIEKFYMEEGKPIPECDVCPNAHSLDSKIARSAGTVLPLSLIKS
jgi:organic radical activating enzyme